MKSTSLEINCLAGCSVKNHAKGYNQIQSRESKESTSRDLVVRMSKVVSDHYNLLTQLRHKLSGKKTHWYFVTKIVLTCEKNF